MSSAVLGRSVLARSMLGSTLRIGTLLTSAVLHTPVFLSPVLLGLGACSSDVPPGALASSDSRAGHSPLGKDRPIVFRSSALEDGLGVLYRMAPDGSQLEAITSEGDITVPEWSPDGEQIAFRWNVEGVGSDVGILEPDHGAPVLLTRGENVFLRNSAVSWSRDGTSVAFASAQERAGNKTFPDTWRMMTLERTGGTARPLLPSLAIGQEAAAWSPDGSGSLVITQMGTTSAVDLWLVHGEAEPAPSNLTAGRVFAPRFPRWSPDSRQIVFAGYPLDAEGNVEGLADHTHGFTPPDAEIFVVDVATQELTRVTDDEWDDTTPAWAPDGEHLLIASSRDGDTDLWLLPITAPEQARNLIDDADSPREDVMPSWFAGPTP
ncbi:MAG TPA: hypothetical protein VFQ61_34485 [Polyangiaceae bacterium]|nr:hypothetical protein [Polyangiaceae bacterium]